MFPSHRERYPEQYQHPMIGKRVEVRDLAGTVLASGTLERVAPTCYGSLAHLDDGGDEWYAIDYVHEVAPT